MSAIMLTPSREISNGFAAKTMDLGELPAGSGNRLPNFLNSENLPFFWENLPDIFGQICQFLLGSLPSIKEINCLLWKNPSPTLRKSATHTKSATDFGKMSHRLWENQPPTLRKAVTNFGEMPSPILGKSVTDLRKSVTDFGEIRHRLWGNPSPTFRKSVANFGESGRQFCEAP